MQKNKFIFTIILLFSFSFFITCALGSTWICTQCSSENNANFCGQCGSAKPTWICYGCRSENTSEYCTNCGMHKHYSAGSFSFDEKKYEDAIFYFNSTGYKDFDYKLFEAHYAIGCILTEQNKYEEALEAFETALSFYSRFFQSKSLYSIKSEKLEEDYSKTLYSIVTIYKALGEKSESTGDVDLAIQNYSLAYEKMDEFAAVARLNFEEMQPEYYERGLVFLRFQKYEEAIKYFDKTKDYLDSYQKYTEASELLGKSMGLEGQLRIVNEVEHEMILMNGNIGYLENLRENDIYVPILIWNNPPFDLFDKKPDVSVTINGIPHTIIGSFSKKQAEYRITTPIQNEGQNTCIWYINNIEVLKYVYELKTETIAP